MLPKMIDLFVGDTVACPFFIRLRGDEEVGHGPVETRKVVRHVTSGYEVAARRGGTVVRDNIETYAGSLKRVRTRIG